MNAIHVAFAALFALLALSLAGMTWLARHERRTRHRAGQREWAIGLTLQTVAWPLFALFALDTGAWRGGLQAIGSGLLVAGYAAMARALLRSLDEQAPGWTAYLPAGALTALLMLGELTPAQRIGLFWLFALLTLIGFVQPLLRQLRGGQAWSQQSVAAIFLVAGVVCLYRLVEQWVWPQSGAVYDAIMTPAQAVALGYFLLAPVFASFAFLMLQQERQRVWLEDLAAQDPLTGVNNRRAFFEQAGRIAAQGRLGGHLAALLMIDVDGFKRVNDRYGHGAGDAVLAKVAAALQEGLRGHDVAGRFGGDEFCALLLDVSAGEAGERAERLRQRIAAQPIAVDGELVFATVSIGVAHVRHDRSIDMEALMAAADRRLYLAKHSGRNRVIASDLELHTQQHAPPTVAQPGR